MMAALIRPRYIFLETEGLALTVIDSQVVAPLTDLARRGIVFDLIALTGIRPAWHGRRLDAQRLKQVRQRLRPGRVWLYAVPFPWSGLGHLCACALIASHLVIDVICGRTVICHCRGHQAALLARMLKVILPAFHYIFDVRGDVATETQVYLNWKGTTEAWQATPMYRAIKKAESEALAGATSILCVSKSHRRQLQLEYPSCADRIWAIPCVATEKLFFFDPGLRDRTRDALALKDRHVLVYAGALEAGWHVPDVMFSLFAEWRTRDRRLHLLLITPDQAKALALIIQAGLSSSEVTLVSAKHDEVSTYLNAGDAGLLLRRSHPLNRVASPTKFAEYAMTGLPVLASKGIGDLDEDIPRFELGVLLERLDDPHHAWQQLKGVLAMSSTGAKRQQRAEVARDLYSAEKFIDQRTRLYQSC